MMQEGSGTAAGRDLKAAYNRDGYVCPIRVLPPEEMAEIRSRLDEYIARAERDPKEDTFLQFKPHFVFPWVDRLIRHPVALDAVETLIGQNILVWNSAIQLKRPATQDFVSWHQDVYYWGNHPDHVVGAWIAIADSTPENGCVRVMPASHKWGILPHVDTYGADNMLSRGQQIDHDIDEDQAVDMVLRAGEMSLHHTRTVHGSRPNQSDKWRIGLVITYMTPATKMTGPRTGATLVRGEDTHNHFDLEDVRPSHDLDPATLSAHDRAMTAFSAAIYEGSKGEGRLAVDRIAKKRRAGRS